MCVVVCVGGSSIELGGPLSCSPLETLRVVLNAQRPVKGLGGLTRVLGLVGVL